MANLIGIVFALIVIAVFIIIAAPTVVPGLIGAYQTIQNATATPTPIPTPSPTPSPVDTPIVIGGDTVCLCGGLIIAAFVAIAVLIFIFTRGSDR